MKRKAKIPYAASLVGPPLRKSQLQCPCVMCGDHDSVHLSSLANIISVSLWTKNKQHLQLIFWSPSRHPSMKSIKETATTGTSKNFSMENLALLICQKLIECLQLRHVFPSLCSKKFQVQFLLAGERTSDHAAAVWCELELNVESNSRHFFDFRRVEGVEDLVNKVHDDDKLVSRSGNDREGVNLKQRTLAYFVREVSLYS